MVTERKQGWLLNQKKIDFKSKTVTRDKEDHYIVIKGLINQKDITRKI